MPLARLRGYTPNGSSLGLLPQPVSWQASFVLGDTGAVKIDYPVQAARWSVLRDPLEVAVEVSGDGGVSWVEPYGGRFLILRRSGDPTERPDVWTVEGASYDWRLVKTVILGEGKLNDDGKRPFLSVPAGVILNTLFQEAQARGAMAGMSWDFNGTVDSAGAAWSQIISLYYEPGLDYLAVLRNLHDQGMIDWTTEGRTVHVWNADTALARERGSAGAGFRLVLGRDLTEAPFKGTIEGVIGHAVVVGDAGVSTEVANPTATQPWGRWETLISQGGVSDPGTMTVLAQAVLDQGNTERVENTYGLLFGGAGSPVPLIDYRPGDYLDVLTTAEAARMRVRQVTLERDSSGDLTGNAVLNDRFLEADVRTSRRVQGITGGSTADGGSGARPAPTTPRDTTVPKTPVDLAGLSAAYIDPAGDPQAQVTLTWAEVTENTDGTAIDDLGGYEVQGRLEADFEPRRLLRAGADTTRVSDSPYDVGSTWLWRVRAGDTHGHWSEWSPEIAVVMASDVTPPAQTSTPTATTRLGTVTVRWDGLSAGGTPMDADLAYVEVHRSDTSGFTPSTATLGDTLVGSGPGFAVFGDQPYNVARYYALVPVDSSGNVGPKSGEVSAVTAPLVNTDLIGEIVSGANIVDGSITASDKVVANSITSTLLAAGSVSAGAIQANAITADKIVAGAVTAEKIQGAAITADKIASGAVTSAKIQAGAITADKIDTYAINGKYITGGTIDGSFIYTQGRGVAGRGWIEIGYTGAQDPVDEVRFIYSSYVSSVRMPTTSYGALRFSLSGAGGATGWLQSELRDGTSGNVLLRVSGGAGTGLKFLPANTTLQVRISDDSDYGNFAANNVLYRSLTQFSSARYKTDLEPVAADGRLLGVRPYRYRYTEGPDVPVVGLLAEDLHAAGLTDLVAYDDQGHPDGVHLNAVVAMLLAEVADMNGRVTRLEGVGDGASG